MSVSDVLGEAHRRELEDGSAIDPTIIAERGYRTLTRRDEAELVALNIRPTRDSFPGLLVPLFRATGEIIGAQFKPYAPLVVKGRSRKYISPHGRPSVLDVHPRHRDVIADSTVQLWITEGIKKGDALTSRGCCAVVLMGVFCFRNKHKTLGDWEDVPLKGREIVVCFDADARKNPQVARAMVRLGRWLYSKGARLVRYLIVPAEVNGTATKGVDDFFAAGGTLDGLLAAATTTEPDTESADDTFTDARLAETIAAEVLADRFVWCRALGWLKWTGSVWTFTSDEGVGEAVRQYVLRAFAEAVERGQKAAMHGWQTMLGASRLRAVLSLTRGIVEREADHFDADPDLLNTPAGVVDLRTGHVLPHDPDFLLTKITRGSYRPGFTHHDWTQALAALRDDARSWWQIRIGQAATGHPTPDGLVVVAQGTGANSKSANTTDSLLPALGDYAAPASPKLLIGSKDTHSTERADLRSQRLLIAEELTDDRALNVTAIKQITDVSQIKARLVCRDNITFTASHSLVVTTNYVPIVSETDHGTWRRFALVVFPFTFRKTGEALHGPADRLGDPGLKVRLRKGSGGQHDAIVTWLVDGARQWYQHGFPALPATVDADTRAWRRQADRILGFWDEALGPDAESCIAATELLAAFNAWLTSSGHVAWSKETFHGRFRGHAETARHHVELRRPKVLKLRLSVPPGGSRVRTPDRPEVYLNLRFRADSEDVDDTEVIDSANIVGTDGTDLPELFSREVDPSHRPDWSVPSVPTCCKGGNVQLDCKLCQHSPTYWRVAK